MTEQQKERFPEHDVQCHWCGKQWRDRHPDSPAAVIWCGGCVREPAKLVMSLFWSNVLRRGLLQISHTGATVELTLDREQYETLATFGIEELT